MAAVTIAGSALSAGRLAKVGVGTNAVDRETGDDGGRDHLGRVELNHPIIQTVTDSGYGAHRSMIVGTLSNNRRAGSTAVTGGESDQVTVLVVADSGQRAVVGVALAAERIWSLRPAANRSGGR